MSATGWLAVLLALYLVLNPTVFPPSKPPAIIVSTHSEPTAAANNGAERRKLDRPARAAALSPDGRYMYFAMGYDLVTYDTATWRQVAERQFNVGSIGRIFCAASPDRLYVPVDSRYEAYGLPQLTRLQSVNIVGNITAIASNGALMYSYERNTRQLRMYDTLGAKMLYSVRWPENIHGIAPLPRSDRILLVVDGTDVNKIVEYDFGTKIQASTAIKGVELPWPAAVTVVSDSSLIYLGSLRRIVVYDPSAKRVVREIPMPGTWVYGIYSVPGGRYAYVVCEGTTDVVVVDTVSHEVERNIPAGDRVINILFGLSREAYIVTKDAVMILPPRR